MAPLTARLLAVNLTGFALLGGASSQGWVTHIVEADSSRLTLVIAALFMIGLYFVFRHSRANIIWIAHSLVVLGLIGTVIGFIQALSGVDVKATGDATSISPMVASLIAGMGTALYTTLVGAVCNLWLRLNLRLLEVHQ